MSPHAVEVIPSRWPLETWERVAGVRVHELPAHLQPEAAWDVRGRKPRYVVTEDVEAWRERVAELSFGVERGVKAKGPA